MITISTFRRAIRTACAALAVAAAAASFSVPAAHANSGPYLPSTPTGHPSSLQSEHRSAECFWFFDCQSCGSNWNFCDQSWWSHVKLYKLEVDYCAYDPCSCADLVGIKLYTYKWDSCYCHYYFDCCGYGAGSIKCNGSDRFLCFGFNDLFFEISLESCGSWGWYHQISDWNHYYSFGLTPFCDPH
jgi:hypothetical protein